MFRGVGQCFCCELIETVYRLFGLEYLFCKNCLSEKVKNTISLDYVSIIQVDEEKNTFKWRKKYKRR